MEWFDANIVLLFGEIKIMINQEEIGNLF